MQQAVVTKRFLCGKGEAETVGGLSREKYRGGRKADRESEGQTEGQAERRGGREETGREGPFNPGLQAAATVDDVAGCLAT